MPETPDWSAPIQAPVTRWGPTIITASEVGQNVPVTSPQPTVRAVLVGLVVVPDWTASSQSVIRSWVDCEAYDQSLGVFIASASISPDAPNGVAFIPYGGAACSLGSELDVVLFSAKGAGSQSVAVTAWYYLQVG